MSSFDYKKEFKDLYMPKNVPQVIDVPSMQFIAVEGYGNPNEADGDYSKSVELLYTLSYTIKMSKKGKQIPAGYFDYVVPPLEGFWWMCGMADKAYIDYEHKEEFHWISVIRQPEFVTEEVFKWAIEEAKKKKPDLPYEKAEFKCITEGKCIQIMHIGTFDEEPATVDKMNRYAVDNGFVSGIGDKNSDGMTRLHHEIYLSDPRKTAPEKRKTIIRHPIK